MSEQLDLPIHNHDQSKYLDICAHTCNIMCAYAFNSSPCKFKLQHTPVVQCSLRHLNKEDHPIPKISFLNFLNTAPCNGFII